MPGCCYLQLPELEPRIGRIGKSGCYECENDCAYYERFDYCCDCLYYQYDHYVYYKYSK